jgi:hypothetical protein
MNGSSGRPVSELLGTYARVLDELRLNGVVRSSNNPVGDYAEYLFCRAFNWELSSKSSKGYDASDIKGYRYQIKGRRLTPQNQSRQLSAIRDIKKRLFDYLAAVLFEANFTVRRAAIIPFGVVRRKAMPDRHVHAVRFLLVDGLWDHPRVRDVTGELRRVGNSAVASTSQLRLVSASSEWTRGERQT